VLNATQGTAIMHHRFEAWRPMEGELSGRANGVLVSMVPGKAVAFGLDGLQERADLFIAPGDEVYEGMICGENARSDDMTVNPTKEKKLTNMRQSSGDILVPLIPHKHLSLEQALEFCREDECVEVTPVNVRIRKVALAATDRAKSRSKKKV
jgi:GTP-binding protein